MKSKKWVQERDAERLGAYPEMGGKYQHPVTKRNLTVKFLVPTGKRSLVQDD